MISEAGERIFAANFSGETGSLCYVQIGARKIGARNLGNLYSLAILIPNPPQSGGQRGKRK